MKAALILLFLGCTYSIASCSVFKRQAPLSYTARGCQLDSLKKQSALIFEQTSKLRGYPKEQVFAHDVYERDSVIIIQWFPVINGSLGNGGVVTISKKDCKVIKEEWYQ